MKTSEIVSYVVIPTFNPFKNVAIKGWWMGKYEEVHIVCKSHTTDEYIFCIIKPWLRHQMETFSALLANCAGNTPVPVSSPHKDQWRGALTFSLICVWINGCVNNREADDLRRHRTHYDIIVMTALSDNEAWTIKSQGLSMCVFFKENRCVLCTYSQKYVKLLLVSNSVRYISYERIIFSRNGSCYDRFRFQTNLCLILTVRFEIRLP